MREKLAESLRQRLRSFHFRPLRNLRADKRTQRKSLRHCRHHHHPVCCTWRCSRQPRVPWHWIHYSRLLKLHLRGRPQRDLARNNAGQIEPRQHRVSSGYGPQEYLDLFTSKNDGAVRGLQSLKLSSLEVHFSSPLVDND